MSITLPCIVAVGETTVDAELHPTYTTDNQGKLTCLGLEVVIPEGSESDELREAVVDHIETLLQD